MTGTGIYKFLSNLDLSKQELQNVKAHNLTTAQRTTLAGTLDTTDKGLFVYDTDSLKLFAWNGTEFADVTPAPPQIGRYRAGVAHTDAEPANLVSGDYVIFTSGGTLTNFVPGAVVQIADKAIYNGTTWDLLQGNVDVATTTTVGLVQLATSAEAIAGTDASKAVTPATLEAKIASDNSSRRIVVRRTLTANTPEDITHNFNSSVQALFLDANDNYKQLGLAYQEVNSNTTRVISNVGGVTVDIYLFKLN